jgi:signal peptidase I
MKTILNKLLDFFELTVLSALIFMTVYFFIGQLVEVSGDSMEPTFSNGQQLLAEKLTVNITTINRGDVVIFNNITNKIEESHLLIKRVIGLPGEKIKIQNGSVYINNEKLKEPYLKNDVYTYIKTNYNMIDGEEYEIGADSYIVMGDNRTNSVDSRIFGALHRNNIIGKVVLRYYPIKSLKIF